MNIPKPTRVACSDTGEQWQLFTHLVTAKAQLSPDEPVTWSDLDQLMWALRSEAPVPADLVPLIGPQADHLIE